MAEETQETAGKNNLSKEQKIGFILMLFFAIFAIGLGVLQIRNTFRAPFALNSSVPAGIKDQVNTVDALRFRDTDRDGLNDFDEIYVYITSAYIADTDSDGIGDKEEVDSGTNPLCAQGTDCAALASAEAEGRMSATGTFGNILNAALPLDPSAQPVDLQVALSDPKEVRKLLLQAGLQKDALDKISDADLMAMVAEVLVANTEGGQSADDSISRLNNLLSTTTKQ